MKGRWLLVIRRMHLYLSVFFAPLLLLFVVTGWVQIEGFGHSSLLRKLSEVHTSQYFPTNENYGLKVKGGLVLAGQTGTARGKASSFRDVRWPTRWLVVAMCFALMISIALGLVLAFTMVRNRIPVWIALILGIATPVLLLAWAHW